MLCKDVPGGTTVLIKLVQKLEESTNESCIFMTNSDETNQYIQCKMCSIRTGLCKMGGKSTSQPTDPPTDLAINVLAGRHIWTFV